MRSYDAMMYASCLLVFINGAGLKMGMSGALSPTEPSHIPLYDTRLYDYHTVLLLLNNYKL